MGFQQAFLDAQKDVVQQAGETPETIAYEDFVEVDDPDFDALSQSLAGAYERAGAGGLSSARGRLAKMGLTGTGAEAATEAYAGNLAGRSQADLESKMAMAQMDWNTLQQERRNAYNAAKTAYEQGALEESRRLTFEYERLSAEMSSRKQSGGNPFLSAMGTLGGAFLGGPAGAYLGKKLFD